MANNKYQCLRCKQIFPKKYNLDKHLKRKNPCQNIDLESIYIDQREIMKNEDDSHEVICGYCQMKFNNKNLKTHQETCSQYNSNASKNNDFLVQINKLKTEFQQQIDELKQQPKIVEQHNQNILQVVCIGNNDNYLDMLTEQWGFDRALGFIKDCALSQLSGDCKLLEKIYFESRNRSSQVTYNRQKVVIMHNL